MANTFETTVAPWFAWLESWFIPALCLHCGLRRYRQFPLCRKCLRTVFSNRAPSAPEVKGWKPGEVQALFRLTPPVKTLVHGFKYRGFTRHIRFLCAPLKRIRGSIRTSTVNALIVPVPLHAARRRERGFNQAELIAREIGLALGAAVVPNALLRIQATPSQTKLDESERVHNLSQAFRADENLVKGKNILLVDDVCTTGSTLGYCRDALLRAGAESVQAFALAWVERRDARGGG